MSAYVYICKEVFITSSIVGVDLPEIFDTAYIRAGPIGDRVSVESLEIIVGLGGLGPHLFEQVGNTIEFISHYAYTHITIYMEREREEY